MWSVMTAKEKVVVVCVVIAAAVPMGAVAVLAALT